MNRDFMEFMRTNYPELARSLASQHFGYTVRWSRRRRSSERRQD